MYIKWIIQISQPLIFYFYIWELLRYRDEKDCDLISQSKFMTEYDHLQYIFILFWKEFRHWLRLCINCMSFIRYYFMRLAQPGIAKLLYLMISIEPCMRGSNRTSWVWNPSNWPVFRVTGQKPIQIIPHRVNHLELR